MSTNYYNLSTPWSNNSAAYMNTPTGNLSQQAPGYSGFNNFQRLSMPAMIPGRPVNNADEITPQEVPMDGSVSLFPQNDYSCIYAKTWTKEGTIATIKFVPEVPVEDNAVKEDPFQTINNRLDKIEHILSNRNRKPHYNKKEVKEHESES